MVTIWGGEYTGLGVGCAPLPLPAQEDPCKQTLRRLHYGGYITAVTLRRLHYGGYITAVTLRRLHYGGDESRGVLRFNNKARRLLRARTMAPWSAANNWGEN
eukprot:1189199-Prorocentrum_minimum.AAC.2